MTVTAGGVLLEARLVTFLITFFAGIEGDEVSLLAELANSLTRVCGGDGGGLLFPCSYPLCYTH